MPIEINTKVSLGPTHGKKIGNLILEDAKFWGRPNFRGETDQFNDNRRKFTVLIPNDVADELRKVGWNVKTEIPTKEQEANGWQMLSHLRVMVDEPNLEKGTGSEVWIKQGDIDERILTETLPVVDRSRFEQIDMEIRAWEYDPENQPGKYNARLEKFIGVLTPNRLDQKWGRLGASGG